VPLPALAVARQHPVPLPVLARAPVPVLTQVWSECCSRCCAQRRPTCWAGRSSSAPSAGPSSADPSAAPSTAPSAGPTLSTNAVPRAGLAVARQLPVPVPAVLTQVLLPAPLPALAVPCQVDTHSSTRVSRQVKRRTMAQPPHGWPAYDITAPAPPAGSNTDQTEGPKADPSTNRRHSRRSLLVRPLPRPTKPKRSTPLLPDRAPGADREPSRCCP
jgi:hypothetical protein